MSTLPPPPDPTDPAWAEAYPQAPPTHRKAAIAVWVTAGVLLLFSTCCVGSLLMIGLMPIEELRAADTADQIPAEAWDQITQIRSAPEFKIIAIVLTLVVFAPAVALLVLGFSVRQGKPVATRVAYWITLVLSVVVGLSIVVSLPNLLRLGPSAIVDLLPSAALLGLLIWCTKTLQRSRAHPAAHLDTQGSTEAASPDDDPWEHML